MLAHPSKVKLFLTALKPRLESDYLRSQLIPPARTVFKLAWVLSSSSNQALPCCHSERSDRPVLALSGRSDLVPLSRDLVGRSLSSFFFVTAHFASATTH